MFGIIACKECKKKRMIDLGDDVTVCPHCQSKTYTKNANVFFQDSDQNIVREVFSKMTGFVTDDAQIPDKNDPLSMLAFRIGHTSDMELKLNMICDGLSEIKETFTLEDVEKVAPGNGEKFLKIMLDECMIYEVSLGKYKK